MARGAAKPYMSVAALDLDNRTQIALLAHDAGLA